MSFWQIFGKSAVSDQGETIQRISNTVSVSSNGTTYTRMGGAQWQKVAAANSAASEIMPFSPDQLDALARQLEEALEAADATKPT